MALLDAAVFANEYFGNTVLDYSKFFAVLILAVIAGKAITWTTKSVLRVFADKTQTKADDIVVDLLEGPVLFTIFVASLHFGQALLRLSEGFTGFYANTVSVLFMINIAWYIIRFTNGLMEHYLAPLTEKTESDLDDHLLPILKRLVNIVVVIIVAIMALDRFDYNVGSLLAGLGIGGLAFALAAKDLVGNFFGGLAILVDKPFKIGDRIKIEGQVDGFVKEIGLRTTRLRTFDTTEVVLPNHKVVDSVVENVSREEGRRIVVNIGVTYDTSVARLEKAKLIVRKHVKRIKGLRDSCDIYFNAFNDSSLNLRLQFWITSQGMKNYWGVQDDLFTSIKKDFEKEGIEFAFPTRTVHMRK